MLVSITTNNLFAYF